MTAELLPNARPKAANQKIGLIGVGRMGQHLTPEVSLDIFGQRHILGIAQVGIGLRLALQLPLLAPRNPSLAPNP